MSEILKATGEVTKTWTHLHVLLLRLEVLEAIRDEVGRNGKDV